MSANFCTFEKGMTAGEYFGGKFVKMSVPSVILLGSGVATGWLPVLGVGAAMAVLPIGHAKWFTRRVPEFTYAVVSREDTILKSTWGPGIHNALPGDEIFSIGVNPIPIDITVKRQTSDGREVTVVLQITVTPHAQIANENGVNAYGAWVIEHDEVHAQSHVRDAIKKPIEGLLTNIIGDPKRDSEQLDKWNLGLGLLVEGEVALHKAPHHLAGHGAYVVEAHGHSVTKYLPPLNGRDILQWYTEEHEEVRAYMDYEDEQFEEAVLHGDMHAAAHGLSHHEAHVGCVFTAAQIIRIEYDAETSAAKKAKYIAEQRAAGVAPTISAVNAGTGKLIGKGVSADTAALLAARAANVDGVSVSGNVFVGADKDIIKAAVAGKVAGDAMKGKK
jgi:hypothetical protein